MGDFLYVEPAQVKVLVVPIGGIGQLFEKHLSAFKTATNIRLVDISPIPQTRFNPQQNSQGRIFLQFTTHYSKSDSSSLSDFEPFRRQLVVLGIGLHQDYSEGVPDDLRKTYPTAITHNCVFFKSPSDKQSSGDVFFVSEEAEHIITSIETILCGVTYNFLKSLHDYASSYENITLRSPFSLIDGEKLTRSIQQVQKRGSTSLKVSYSNGQSVPPNKADQKLKSLQKQSGRQAKIMGNFYLLAGCTIDAIQYFTDAAINTKKSEDYLWLAGALEGLSVATLILHYLSHQIPATNPMLYSVLQLPKTKTFSIGSTSNRSSSESLVSRQSTIMSPRNSITSSAGNTVAANSEFSRCQPLEFLVLLCLRASHYYQQSMAEIEDCIPDIVYVESLLRSIDLLQTAYLVGSDAVAQIIEAVFQEDKSKIMRVGTSIVTKESIMHEVRHVFTLELSKLDVKHIYRVYAKVVSVLGELGLYRRQGFVLRQYLVALQASLANNRESSINVQMKPIINSIIDQILSIYHIFQNLELGIQQSPTWASLQLCILNGCLDVVESLQEHGLAAKICVLLLHNYMHCLNSEEQQKLKEKLNWLILNMHSERIDKIIPYPDPFLIRQVVFHNEIRELLGPFPSTVTKTDDVVFNPYSKPASTKIDMSKVVCVEDQHLLKIEFQNPYHFDICIKSIEAITANGVSIEINRDHARVLGSDYVNGVGPIRATFWKDAPSPSNNSQLFENGGSTDSLRIPGKTITAVEFQFRPLDVGELIIKSFRIGVDQFGPQNFSIVDKEVLPVSPKVKYEVIEHSTGGLRLLDGLLDRLVKGEDNERLLRKSFELTVIPKQPKLSLVENLISNGWIMLLEGQRQKCHIKLCNASDDIVDYLSFSPWDTSLEAITSTLSSKDNKLGAEDIHELEWQLLKKKALEIKNKDEIAKKYSTIEPGLEVTIEFDVFGKRLVKEMRLTLEYGMKNEVDISRGFIKSMTIPFKVSVYKSVEVFSSDVMPLLPKSIHDMSSMSPSQSLSKNFEKLVQFLAGLENENTACEFCLLVLDLRNHWRERLCVGVRYKVTAGLEFQLEETINPDHTSRFLIPVKRAEHGIEFYSDPIPSLQHKQFIKNYDLSQEQQAQEKLSYWIRSSLLENLIGEWKTVDNNLKRSGEIDMRRIRLAPSLISALVQDSVLIQHEIVADDSSARLVKLADGHIDLLCQKFYTIQTRITNNTNTPISGMIRYIPIPVHAKIKQDLSIDKRILYNGVLQRHVGAKPIEPGSSITMKMGFLVLEKGVYEWGCVFDQGVKARGTVNRDPLYIRAK